MSKKILYHESCYTWFGGTHIIRTEWRIWKSSGWNKELTKVRPIMDVMKVDPQAFLVRPSKFWSGKDLLNVNKSCFYQFSVYLSGNQILEKNWKIVMTYGPLMVNMSDFWQHLPSGGHLSRQFFSFSLILSSW